MKERRRAVAEYARTQAQLVRQLFRHRTVWRKSGFVPEPLGERHFSMIFRLSSISIIGFIVLTLVIGCENAESVKKVSLEKRAREVESPFDDPDQGTLKFGFDLRLGPKEDVRIYLPFLKYLEKRVGRKFSLEFTQKYDDTVQNLGTGVTHFAALGPVSAVIGKERHGVGCLVMGLNHQNRPEYRATIFTRTDSTMADVSALKGKTFAFGNKLSTQGHVIPRKMLEDAGIHLQDLGGFIFTSSHANTAGAVLEGDYDAGGMQDSLAERLTAEGKIKVLATSVPYPSSLICYNKNVDPEIVQAVKAALLAFDPAGEHASLLVDWDKTEMPNGFTECKQSSLTDIADLVRRYGLLK